MINTLNVTTFTDRNLIESVLRSFYIVDYGTIKTVNADGTINVVHAKKQQTMDGKELPEDVTNKVEVLTIGNKEFSLQWKLTEGDQVLLLGLKDYVKNVKDVTKATSQDAFIHYCRNTMKALPLSVFNDSAKVKIEIESGNMEVTATKIKLNGDSKQFVTWAELNQALTTFLTQLTTAMTTTPIVGNGSPQPTWTGLPTSIDISNAKTTSIVTGG